MDPVSTLATASAAFSALKKGFAIGPCPPLAKLEGGAALWA